MRTFQLACAAVALFCWGGLALTACRPVADVVSPTRALCYANADAAAQERADVECHGVPFEECPFAEEILADLQAAQERCP